MLIQKLYKSGNSVVLSIPKAYLEDLSLKEGSEVVLDKEPHVQTITIQPKSQITRSSITPEFLKWLEGFNKQYGPALQKLARH